MKQLLSCLAAGILLSTQLIAAQATFSKDGNSVFSSPLDGPYIEQLFLKPYREETIDLSKIIGKQDVYEVTLRTTDGSILFNTRTQVWAFHPTKRFARKLCDIPRGCLIDDLAYDPSTGGVLITALAQVAPGAPYDRPTLWWLAREADSPSQVLVNRIGQMEGLVVSPSGEIFFGCEGDLWHGVISADTEAISMGKAGSLVAYRYVPLATRETFSGAAMQVGARNVAFAGAKLYAHVRRLGDTGWGTIVRVNTPENVDPNEASGDTFERRLDNYKKAMGSVEIVKRSNHRGRLCATPDGHRVFFAVDDEPFLAEDGGPAKSIAPPPDQKPQSSSPTIHTLEPLVIPDETPESKPSAASKPSATPKPKFHLNGE